jgi:drug/metabolite transporter (DMT)-like permease
LVYYCYMIASPLVIVIFGIGAAIAWGSADYLAAKASRRSSPNAAALGVTILSALLFTILFVFNHGTHQWNLPGVLYGFGAGISLEVGLLMFYKGLDAGPVNLVSPISSAYPLVSTAVVLLLFGGTLRRMDIIGIIVVVTGIAIASGILNTSKSERRLSKGIIYALLTVVIWGLAYALIGKSVSALGWQKASLVDFYAGLAVLPLVLTLVAGKKFWKSVNSSLIKDKYIITSAIAQTFGGIIFSIGLTHARSSAVLTAISATYPALTIFLALKGLKEKAQTTSLIGAFITILGIIVLSV